MMAKRLLGFILGTILGIFGTLGQDTSLLVYDGITPSPGSEISSFDFILKFDLSNVIAEYGSGDYGVGWAGYHNDKRPEKEKSITIYKGNPSDGIVVGRVCDANYNGGSANFIPSSDINIRIDGAIPEEGVTYTMIICNEFKTFVNGSGVPITNSVFDCFTTPITYTFVGGSASGESLSITECSLQNGASLDQISEISYSFNMPIRVNSSIPLVIKNGEEIYASSAETVLSDDKTSVTYKFENALLLLGQSYVISLPKGAISSDTNSSETNETFNIPVTGTYVNHFNLKSGIPSSDQKTVFIEIHGVFDMPDGLQIYKKPDYALNLTAYLYRDEVAEANLIGLLTGTYNEGKNGIIWTNTFPLEPNCTYVLYKPEGEFRAYNPATDKFSTEWYNGEVNIVVNTPSIEEAGFAQMEFDTPIIGKHGVSQVELNCDEPIASLSTIEITLKDFDYYVNGIRQGLFYKHEASNIGYIYDITSGEPVLVKEFFNSIQTRENPTRYYYAISASINTIFFDGHRYRIVIPEDTYTISTLVYKNYIFNKDIVYEFDGATPEKVELVNCSLEDGATRTSLSSVAYEFKGTFKLREGATALYKGNVTSWDIPVSVSYSGGNTKLLANCVNSNTGEPFELSEGREYAVTLPAGILYYEANPELANEEIVRTFIGKVAPVIVEPEFVNLEVEINGFHAIGLEAVKGHSTTVKLIPDNNWKVDKILRDGNPVTEFYDESTGIYTSPKLTADSKIQATIEYKHELVFADISTGIAELPNSNVRIYSDGNDIVIEGLNGGESIEVYSIAGMVIGKHTAVEDTVRISAVSGQYIVRVNNDAAKIIH